ncbi:MAG: hypothetical protein JNL72_14155 [Flavipsychrobacter sp.]|nr:hypothetical protein [Flavipsychrobacter sp.]
MKRNVPIFGFLIGLLAPVLGFFIVYFVMGGNSNGIGDFFGGMFRSKTEAALILTLSLLINIAPFIYFTNKRLDLTARGILVATVLYATLIILVKYVW